MPRLLRPWQMAALAVFILGSLGFFFFGTDSTPKPLQAQEAVAKFMDARLARDEAAASKYLTPKGQKSYDEAGLLLIPTSNPHFTAYSITDPSKPSARELLFTVTIQETYTADPYSSLVTEDITVIREGDGYLIDQVAGSRQALARGENGALYLELTDQPPGKLIELVDLPNEFTPQGAGTDVAFGVGRDAFGPVAIAPDQSIVAFITQGLHPLLAYLYLSPDLAEQQLTGIDLFFEAGGEELAWSGTGKYLAAIINTPAGSSTLLVFDSNGRRIALPTLQDKFPHPNYALTSPRWHQDLLSFTVSAGETEKIDSDLLGIWLLDIERKTLEKK